MSNQCVLKSAYRPQSFRRFAAQEYQRERNLTTKDSENVDESNAASPVTHGLRAFTVHGYVNSLRKHSKHKLNSYLHSKYPTPFENVTRQYSKSIPAESAAVCEVSRTMSAATDPGCACTMESQLQNPGQRHDTGGIVASVSPEEIGVHGVVTAEAGAEALTVDTSPIDLGSVDTDTPCGRFLSRAQSFAHGATEDEDCIIVPVEDVASSQDDLVLRSGSTFIVNESGDACAGAAGGHHPEPDENTRESSTSSRPFPVLWQIYSRGGFEDFGDYDLDGLISFSTEKSFEHNTDKTDSIFAFSLTRDLKKKLGACETLPLKGSCQSPSDEQAVEHGPHGTNSTTSSSSSNVKDLISIFNQKAGGVLSCCAEKHSQSASSHGPSEVKIHRRAGLDSTSKEINAWEKKIAYQRQQSAEQKMLGSNVHESMSSVRSCEDKSSLLPRLFGNVSILRIKKGYSHFFVKNASSANKQQANLKQLRDSVIKQSTKLMKISKKVHFGKVEILFFSYTIGQGVPSGVHFTPHRHVI
jgi:hypothetical protein